MTSLTAIEPHCEVRSFTAIVKIHNHKAGTGWETLVAGMQTGWTVNGQFADISDLYSEMSDVSCLSDFDDLPRAIQCDLSNGSLLDSDKFKVVHYNIDSLTANGRIETLSDVCNNLNISVLILTETHLDDTIPNNVMALTGYHDPVRHDRQFNGRYGGGCIVYILETLTYKHQATKQSDHYEHICVDVKEERKLLAINCLYRPPIETADNHQLFIQTAENILDSLSRYEADLKMISSDLNVVNCYCVSPPLPFKPIDHSAPELFTSYGFKQLIDIPTRERKSISLMDLVYVTNEDFVEEF